MSLPAVLSQKLRLPFAARRFSRSPRHLFAGLLVAALTIYLVSHIAMLYGKLDFRSTGLGGSEVTDFFVYYAAAHMVGQTGEAAALYDPQALKAVQLGLGGDPEGLHPFNYPPSYTVLIWPLAALPYAIALICWQWFGVVLFGLSLWLAGLRRAEILAGVVAPASALNLSAGQNGFLTSALLIAGMALLARREKTAGLLFGLLTVKPHLGLLIPLAALAGRHWRAISAAAAAAAGLIGLSIAVLGVEAWPAYLRFLDWFRAEAAAQPGGPFLAHSASVLQAAQVAGLPAAAGYVLQLAVTLLVCVAVYRAYRGTGAPDLQLALLLVGTSLAMPYGFVYDLPFVAVAVILVARIGLRDGFRPYEAVCLLAAWLLPFVAGTLNSAGVPLLPVAHLTVFCWILARLATPQDRRGA